MRSSGKKTRVANLATVLLGLSSSVAAQAVPDAGAFQRRIEQERQAALPSRGQPEPETAPLPPPMRNRGGARIVVDHFTFVGAHAVDEQTLRAAVSPLLGRPLDFDELRAAPRAVAAAYRRAGWVVRAYLPAQDIRGGVVAIQVVEARFGQVHTTGRIRHARERQIVEMATAPLAPGRLVKGAALDRGLLLAGDTPGVSVAGALGPGARERETDLTLRLADRPLASGMVSLDNGGERATGAMRASAAVTLAGLLGRGDALEATAIHSRGSDYVGGRASAPAGSSGLRIAVAGSYLHYRLTAPDYASLDATGESVVAGVEARYPLVRARTRNLFLEIRYQHKAYRNEASGVIVSRYAVDEGEAALSGNLFDRLGGADTASLSATIGALELGGSPNAAVDALTTRAAGRFGKIAYRVGRRQAFGPDVTASVEAFGQVASKNLDSSEKIYLGGPDGVRAYPTNEAGGAEGEIVETAIERRLPGHVTVAGFYDWGHVRINTDNRYVGAPAVNAESLQGPGLAVTWRPTPGAWLRATWSHRLGTNPNPTASGLDQDGSLLRNRFWLSASVGF